ADGGAPAGLGRHPGQGGGVGAVDVVADDVGAVVGPGQPLHADDRVEQLVLGRARHAHEGGPFRPPEDDVLRPPVGLPGEQHLPDGALLERPVVPVLHAHAPVGAADEVVGQRQHVPDGAWSSRRLPWRRMARPAVSARRPRRSVSRAITSSGATLPRLTSTPRWRTNHFCWAGWGASKMMRSAGTRETSAVMSGSRTRPSGW